MMERKYEPILLDLQKGDTVFLDKDLDKRILKEMSENGIVEGEHYKVLSARRKTEEERERSSSGKTTDDYMLGIQVSEIEKAIVDSRYFRRLVLYKPLKPII